MPNPASAIPPLPIPSRRICSISSGPGGVPEESIRLMVTAEALQDLRALTWLEQLRGREFVEQLIGADITFDRYPKGADYVLSLRRRVNEAIVAAQK